MLVQISSGTGPIECEIAVGKLYLALCDEYSGKNNNKRNIIEDGGDDKLKVINYHQNKHSISANTNTFKSTTSATTNTTPFTSILFETKYDLSKLAGTHLWRNDSIRPGHRRSRWFINVSVIPEVSELNINSTDIKIDFMHSGGNGGQNVNKVETGVRLTHIPTGITTESTEFRTQGQNRRAAYDKLCAIIDKTNQDAIADQKNFAWTCHNDLERGNAIRTYKGDAFKLIEDTTGSNGTHGSGNKNSGKHNSGSSKSGRR